MYAREIAVTNFRLGDAHAMDGDWMAALAAYRRSLERVQAAAASDPDDALARADLAESHGAVILTPHVVGIRVTPSSVASF